MINRVLALKPQCSFVYRRALRSFGRLRLPRKAHPLEATASHSSPTYKLQPPPSRITRHVFSTFVSRGNREDSDSSLDEYEHQLESIDSTDSNACLNALRCLASEPTKGGSARRAEAWMSRLEERNEQLENVLNGRLQMSYKHPLNAVLEGYCCTIQAWARADGEEPAVSVKRAQNWLDKARGICNTYEGSPKDIEPWVTNCYNSYLDACSKGRGAKINKDVARKHAQVAEETLTFMIEHYTARGAESFCIPNIESFNYVLRAITRCRFDTEMANRASKLLQFMNNSVQNDNKDSSKKVQLVVEPNAKSFSMVLDSLSGVAKRKAHSCQHSKPLVDDPGQNGDNELELLNDLLEFMEHMFELGAQDIIENNIPFNTRMSALANVSGTKPHANAPKQAEELFSKMEALSEKHHRKELAPDSTTYLQVIRAWANSGLTSAGEKSSLWLAKQLHAFEATGDESLHPSRSSFIAAIRGWSSVGKPALAEVLLTDCMGRKVPQLEPNTEMFSSVIQAWLKIADSSSSGVDEKSYSLRRALYWVEFLIEEERDSGPTTTHDSFLGILKAARKCASGRKETLELATHTLKLLKESRHHVDHIAYSCLLQIAIHALSRPENYVERADTVTHIVQQCCDDGLVSRDFVRALSNGATYETGWTIHCSHGLTNELFPTWPLPPSWTRNIKHKAVLPSLDDFQRKNTRVLKNGQNPCF